MSLLSSVEMAPRDPILGLNEQFNADPNPNKVNLGVGVYTDENGKLPLLTCVAAAEKAIAAELKTRGYLPIDGLASYDKAVQHLVFGAESSAVTEGRVATVQALGGTGGLKVGADLLKLLAPEAGVYISDPSWENHRALFEQAGFKVHTYPYYDAKTHGLDFPAMMGALRGLPAGAIVVLHACCHNPTGVDLEPDQWTQLIEVVKSRELTPFLDFAYQGFAEGIDADGVAVRRFAEAGMPIFVSNSFSKSFSLYGERVGALSVIGQTSEEAARVLSQLKRVVRTNYSSPPTLGGQIVAKILTTPELRQQWESELTEMRERIKTMRTGFVDKIHARVKGVDFSFVRRQRGMFSYSGLTKAQVLRLRSEYSIYAIDSGRICVAALNTKNLDYVADAIAKVIA